MTRAAFQVPRPRTTALRALNYIPAVERMRAGGGGSDSRPLAAFLRSMGENYGSVFTRIDCNAPLGVELLSQSDMFATEPEGRRIRKDSMPTPEKHRVRRWQVLIAGAGTLGPTELYGRAILADDRLEGKYVGPHAMVLDFHDPASDEALFTYAFLCTRFGIQAVRSASYGTKILSLRTDLLRSLPVPKVEPLTQRRVADAVRSSVAARERAHRTITQLRATINSLPEVRAAAEMCVVRGRKAIAWDRELPTLHAWNFASTGGALAFLGSQWRLRLGDVIEADGVYYGERFNRMECEPPHGMDFVSQRDVFLVRPIPRRVVVSGGAPQSLIAPEHALLLGGHGQLSEGSLFGRVEYAGSGLSQYALSEDILRIIPEKRYTALCFAFLSTKVGLRLLQSTAVGTSIPKMRLDLAADLPLPEVGSATEQSINDLARTVIESRRKARDYEAKAVDLIETEVIPAWLS